VFYKVKLSVKVKLFGPLLCVWAILPAKAVSEMTYTVSGAMLNPTHSLTLFLCAALRLSCKLCECKVMRSCGRY